MLDKMSKKIIKCCVKYYRDKISISTEDLQEHLSYTTEEIYHCCKNLNDLNFFDDFSVAITHDVTFFPSYNLYFFREQRIAKIKSFVIKSILVPIAVSIATSILTTWILQTLLSMII